MHQTLDRLRLVAGLAAFLLALLLEDLVALVDKSLRELSGPLATLGFQHRAGSGGLRPLRSGLHDGAGLALETQRAVSDEILVSG